MIIEDHFDQYGDVEIDDDDDDDDDADENDDDDEDQKLLQYVWILPNFAGEWDLSPSFIHSLSHVLTSLMNPVNNPKQQK